MNARMVMVALLLGTALSAQQSQNPRQQPGAMVHIFAPEQHDLYDGRFVISANRIHMVGGLNDPEGIGIISTTRRRTSAPSSGTAAAST